VGKAAGPAAGTARSAPPAGTPAADEPKGDEEEEEGGLSAVLQPGEQVQIGALNIAVKKFIFHAYLTDRRIFLIDTQEKKLKVTAKDIPLETITGSIVEFSENSDPVLVLSLRSPDDEIKTMKLVFTQNGMDRSPEIDEWITLLNEQTRPKKPKKAPVRREPGPEEEERPAPERVSKPAAARQELRPVKKTVKDHEKQPPVKRLLSLYQTAKEKETEEPELEEEQAPKEPVKKHVVQPKPYREIPPARPAEEQPPVKKPDVQSAMKTAIRGAVQPPRQPPASPVKRAAAPEPVRRVVQETGHEPAETGERTRPLREKEPEPAEEEGAAPIFCHNCGKKLPASANFCPGCGTKLTHHRPAHHPVAHGEKKSQKAEPAPQEEKPPGHPPKKTPVKKAPKGSEMTILHKFLRR
jgi:hypothetical protein